MSIRLFAFSAAALGKTGRAVRFSHCSGYCTAASSQEAQDIALAEAVEVLFPQREGWIGHDVSVQEIMTDKITLAQED